MKIIWISDSVNLYTGFGTQSLAILKHFQKSHDVLQLGWFCSTETEHEGIKIKPLGTNYGDSRDIKKYYKEFEPDIVISLGDIQMVKSLSEIQDPIFQSKWIHWLPVDGEPYPKVFDTQIRNIEHVVAMSDFGYNVCKDHFDLHKIYHGIDKEIFKPLENRDILRAKEGLHNHFVCLLVAQNQWRKNIPSMVEAFGRFAKNKKNVDLIIHTKPISLGDARGWNIYELVNQYNLAGKIRVSSESYTSIKMNRLYNCANLLVSSTQGEGFGLPHAEAMMAGIPLLLPDYTTSREQILPEEEQRCGEFIKIASFAIQSGVNIKRAIIDIDDCADKLEKLYDDFSQKGTLLKEYGQIGRYNAIKRYDINKITREWDTLIHKIARWQKENIIQSPALPITLQEIC